MSHLGRELNRFRNCQLDVWIAGVATMACDRYDYRDDGGCSEHHRKYSPTSMMVAIVIPITTITIHGDMIILLRWARPWRAILDVGRDFD